MVIVTVNEYNIDKNISEFNRRNYSDIRMLYNGVNNVNYFVDVVNKLKETAKNHKIYLFTYLPIFNEPSLHYLMNSLSNLVNTHLCYFFNDENEKYYNQICKLCIENNIQFLPTIELTSDKLSYIRFVNIITKFNAKTIFFKFNPKIISLDTVKHFLQICTPYDLEIKLIRDDLDISIFEKSPDFLFFKRFISNLNL